MKITMRYLTCVLAVMVTTGLSASATSVLGQPPAPPAPVETAPAEQAGPERVTISPRVVEFVKPIAEAPDDDELVKKLKERHNVAVKLFEARIGEYRRNVADLLQVLDAAKLVIDAKLDLAPDRDTQIMVFEQAHEVALTIEGHFQKLRDAGLGAASDLERAKLARLNVEVQILKLKRQQP